MLFLELLSRWDYRGKWRLYHALHSIGLLSGTMTCKIEKYECVVPADASEFWVTYKRKPDDVYDFKLFSQIISDIGQDFVLLDMGANIGISSVIIISLCDRIYKVVAFEPNTKAYNFLIKNLSSLVIETQALNAAVSDFDGTAAFFCDITARHDQAGHMASYGGQQVRVVKADSICLDPIKNIAIKIDVEGEERNAIRGAQRLLKESDNVVLFVEIHPSVIRRSGISADEIFAEAEKVRSFSWRIADAGLPTVDRSKLFFNQFPETRHYDVIGVSVP